MAYEHYPSPQSMVAAFLELTRYLFGRARLEARGLQQEAADPLTHG
jgi:hypothetical protein